MSELGDVFGEEFEEEYSKKEQQRQERMNKAEKKDVMEACWHAVDGDGFDGEEPRFTMDAGEVEYDVLLMKSPDNNIGKFIHDLPDSFGASGRNVGMFHLGELFSCSFIEDMEALVEKIEEDQHYIVLGNYQENETDGDTYYNISPVAGIVPIAQAKKYSEKYGNQMEGSSIEEQKEQQKSESDESSDSSESDDISLDEDNSDDEYADEDIVLKVFKKASSKKEELMRSVADGDEDSLDKLTKLVDKNTDGKADTEFVADIYEEHVDDIDGRGEDEDDDMNLGLDGESDESDDLDMDADEDGEEAESEENDDDDDSEDGGEGVEDWF